MVLPRKSILLIWLLSCAPIGTLGQRKNTKAGATAGNNATSPDEIYPSYNSTNDDDDLPDLLSRCMVCGEDYEVSLDGKFVGTDFGMFTCSSLEGAGKHGNIPLEHCASAKDVAAKQCGCQIVESIITAPNDNAEAGGTDAQLAQIGASAPPQPSHYVCNICAGDTVPTIQDAIVPVPFQLARTCNDYITAAQSGAFGESQCWMLQKYTTGPCGCAEVSSVAETELDEAEDVNVEVSDTESYVCSICGTGMIVGNAEAIVVIPGQSQKTCAQIDLIAKEGRLSVDQCGLVQPFVSQHCMCEKEKERNQDTTPPPELEEPVADVYSCNICGEGMEVTNMNATVSIPTQPDRSCEDLLYANEIGNINPTQCKLLHPYVAGPCGCEPIFKGPTWSPTLKPTASPTKVPTPATISPAPTGYSTVRSECFDSLLEIHELEKALLDTETRRKYILCPGTTFHMGSLLESGEIVNGEPFLMLRPNVIYQCGEDGSRSNECVLKGGDFALTSHYGALPGVYEIIDNVKIIGLTFEAQNLISVVLEAAGHVEFIDCIFRKQANLVPILMQWRREGPTEAFARRNLASLEIEEPLGEFGDPSGMNRELQQFMLGHKVTFRKCIFRENVVTDRMGFPGIIENTYGSELVVKGCLFEGNVYGDENNPAPYGYAIRSFGPFTVESSCFLDNEFHTHGPILVHAAAHTEADNFVRTTQNNLSCDFVALFGAKDYASPPSCFDSDATTCSFVRNPTASPTQPPKSTRDDKDDSTEDSTSSSVTRTSETAPSSSTQTRAEWMTSFLMSLFVSAGLLLPWF